MPCLFQCSFNSLYQRYLLRKASTVTPFWNFKGRVQCKPVHIYDGDTIHAVIVLHHKLVKLKLRMLGYDSPEMKPLKSKTDRESEIAAAKLARDALAEKVLNKCVTVELGDFDKYGRPLATLYVGNLNINEWMIEQGHGYAYHGGTKTVVNYDQLATGHV